MDNEKGAPDRNVPLDAGEPRSDVYQAPRIESVLTADELAREIQYAGAPSVDMADG